MKSPVTGTTSYGSAGLTTGAGDLMQEHGLEKINVKVKTIGHVAFFVKYSVM